MRKGPSDRPRKVKPHFDWNSEKTKFEDKSREDRNLEDKANWHERDDNKERERENFKFK